MATLKQIKAFKYLVENNIDGKVVTTKGGKLKNALKAAGYAKSVYDGKNSSFIKRSKGWKDLVREYLPDQELLDKHRELLNKKETVSKLTTDGIIVTAATGEIDTQAVSKALELAYKIKGSYAPEKNINLNIDAEKLKKEINESINLFRKREEPSL